MDCSDDKFSPDYVFRKEFTEDRFAKLLGYPEVEAVQILERDSAGYVLRIAVGEALLTGEQFRNKLDLHSSDVTVVKDGALWVVTTKGIGHGLGLSQYTAQIMAKDGKTYEEILTCFFPGTKIKKIE